MTASDHGDLMIRFDIPGLAKFYNHIVLKNP